MGRKSKKKVVVEVIENNFNVLDLNEVDQATEVEPPVTPVTPVTPIQTPIQTPQSILQPIQQQAPQPEVQPYTTQVRQRMVEQVEDTFNLIKEYRHVELEDVLSNVDIDSETKLQVIDLFWVLEWITDLPHIVYVCALYNEWKKAHQIVQETYQHSRNSSFGWKLLRKMLGNWNEFRDRKQLKDLCLSVIQKDVKAMASLNRWAIEQAKKFGIVAKGYCDLCVGDSKMFAMMYSAEL